MDINNQIIDWNAPDILMQIATSIQDPLSSIVEASSRIGKQKRKGGTGQEEMQASSADIIFSNTREISRLISEVAKAAKSKSIKVADKEVPAIFEIYAGNTSVQAMCKTALDASRVSKSDQSWLVDFEKLVFEQIKKNQMNLYDLSYNLAISERQLHRKIKHLLGLTPNKYIRIIKLHHGYELIDQYVYDTISEVSYAVGYFDTHYFSKLFLKQYGIMPKELLVSKK